MSEAVHRYAKHHFKRNWEKRVEEIRLSSTHEGASFVYLPHEVILMKQAVSKEEQIRLFSHFVPFITADGRQADQSLCAEDRCTLFTSTMTDQKDENLQKLGSTLFSETAEQLANIQKVKPGYTDQKLQMDIEKAPRFPALHGVWYNENGYLRSHRDRTWDQDNKTSQTEWVLSISLGSTARFTYHHPQDIQGNHSTTVLVESGDVLLFNGAYLYHGVQVLEHSIPNWWEKELSNLQGRLNLQYRVLTGNSRYSEKNESNEDARYVLQEKTAKKNEIDQHREKCLKVPESSGRPSTVPDGIWLKRVEGKPSDDRDNAWLMRVENKPSTDGDNAWLMRVEDKPSTDRDNAWLMRVEDKSNTDSDNAWLMRVEDKPSTDRDNAWLMRVVDKPKTDRDNAWLMRVEDKPSTDRDNAWLMRVEDKPSTDGDNAWLMRVEDKPSTDRDNAWLMRVEDKPSTDRDNAWLMRVEDKPSTDRDNAWLMRVEDKPSTDGDNAWLMTVEDKPSTDGDNAWLMRVEDKPNTDRDNAWLMRVEDKPSTDRDNAWLMRVEDKPNTDRDNAWLMRVEDKPSTDGDNAWLMRVEDKPNTDRDNAWLMKVEDKPSTDGDNAWLMRVEDKPSTDRGNAWLMRVEDKPSTDGDNAWLMRVEDKPGSDRGNAWLMRVEDKPSTDGDNAWLMRVEDKPSTDGDNAWLMRVEDKPNTDRDNAWLMRVEDKPSTDGDNAWLMRVEDKPSTDRGNAWLMRVEDKPNTDDDNAWLMRVEDKPSTDGDNAWLMRVENKPSTDGDNAWLMRVEDKPRTTEKVFVKGTKRNENDNTPCKVGFLNYSVPGLTSSSDLRCLPKQSYRRIPETTSWLPLVNEIDEDVMENPSFTDFEVFPKLGFPKTLFRQFWCFNYTINKDHQRRAIRALGGNGNTNDVKKDFYEKLKLIQGLNIPVHEHNIVLSFENSDVVESMYKAGLLVNPKKFIINGNHIFSKKEQQEISKKTTQALEFIRQADSVLYESMLQVVACIGYYKAAEKGHLGGTVSSAVGLIWLDPSKGGDWSIPFLAEQIVHEYIHTTLFIAEMVRGTYTDAFLVPKSLVVSAIRRQKRGYDKSFHAAYVATGLVAFHAFTGSSGRASELSKYLNQSVLDLEKVQLETGVLDETGVVMLLHLKTFLRKAKVM